jgi:hypothetical protein
MLYFQDLLLQSEKIQEQKLKVKKAAERKKILRKLCFSLKVASNYKHRQSLLID